MVRVSIIIPVLHETDINGFLDPLFEDFSHAFFEVIVVDGDPLGMSVKTIERPDVICLVATAGRGPQMNAGARVARGDVVLFLHCDTQLPKNAFEKIQETLGPSRFKAGAFTLRFNSKKKIYSLIARGASLRCRLTRIPYGDQAFFMTRRFFFQMGGFMEIPVMEDMDLMRRIARRGERVRILGEAVSTSPRRWEEEGILFSLLRTWVLATLFLCGVSPERLRPYYRADINKKRACK